MKNVVNEYMDVYKRSFQAFYTSLKEVNWKDFTIQMFYNLLICVCFVFFCSLKEGSADLYMSVFIPIFVVNTLIILYSCLHQSSSKHALLTIFLLTTGTTLQIFMMPANSVESLREANKYVLMAAVGVLGSLCVMPVVRNLSSKKKSEKNIIWFMLMVTLMTYLLLFFAGSEVSGTKAWLSIGNFGFQLTEITKLFALFSVPLIINYEGFSEKQKSLVTVIMLCLHALFLVLLNELGTLMIVFLSSIITRLIFAKNKKFVIAEVLSYFLLVCIAISTSYGVYKMVPDYIRNPIVDESGNTKLNDAEKIVYRVAKIYPKIEHRINIFLRDEHLTSDDLHQINNAEDALLQVSLFGSSRGSLASVPEINCDFVFIYLVVRLGLVGTLLVFLSITSMLSNVAIEGTRYNTRHSEYMISFIFVSSIVLQALLCACSNLSLFPIVGLPFPFLSSGGTSLCVNLFMVLYITSFLRRGENYEQKH